MNPSCVYTNGMQKYPNKVRHFRVLADMSQEQLGNKVGRTKDAISKWERGERKLKMEEARRLATALNVSVGQLADDVGNMYGADDDLMQKSVDAIQEAAKSIGARLTLSQAMTYTVELYNHVLQYRRKGINTAPDEAMAALVLKQINE